MNERMLDLAKQAYEDVIKNTPSFLVTKELYEQKFAELIVKKVLDEVSTRAFVSGDRAWSDDADRHWVELEFGFGRLAKLKKK